MTPCARWSRRSTATGPSPPTSSGSRAACGRERSTRRTPDDGGANGTRTARGGRLSTLLVGAQQVVTCRGPARARRGTELAALEVLPDAAVLIDGERIAWVGPRREAGDLQAIEVVEVSGVLFPGFIDCHTHAVFGAPRLDDHERRALGENYQAIAAAGGGILESVRDVRARTERSEERRVGKECRSRWSADH